jgi:hypothetical protein
MDQLARFAAGEDVPVSVASVYRWRDPLDSFRMNGGESRGGLVGANQMPILWIEE